MIIKERDVKWFHILVVKIKYMNIWLVKVLNNYTLAT